MFKRSVTMTALALLIAGCGGEPLDVAGSYSVNLTNGANGCDFDSWTVGETSSNIPVLITQEGTQVDAEVQGLAGLFVEFWLGSRVYSGSISGNDLDLTLYGTQPATRDGCTYTVNSSLRAEVVGDIMTGQIRYEAATVDNPACAPLQGCASVQSFNGARPPSQ